MESVALDTALYNKMSALSRVPLGLILILYQVEILGATWEEMFQNHRFSFLLSIQEHSRSTLGSTLGSLTLKCYVNIINIFRLWCFLTPGLKGFYYFIPGFIQTQEQLTKELPDLQCCIVKKTRSSKI